MADPGFPVGGAVDPRGGYVSKILHVKTKESGTVGGARAGRAPLDPPMWIMYIWTQNACDYACDYLLTFLQLFGRGCIPRIHPHTGNEQKSSKWKYIHSSVERTYRLVSVNICTIKLKVNE